MLDATRPHASRDHTGEPDGDPSQPTPMVTVGLAVYNGEKFLGQANVWVRIDCSEEPVFLKCHHDGSGAAIERRSIILGTRT